MTPEVAALIESDIRNILSMRPDADPKQVAEYRAHLIEANKDTIDPALLIRVPFVVEKYHVAEIGRLYDQINHDVPAYMTVRPELIEQLPDKLKERVATGKSLPVLASIAPRNRKIIEQIKAIDSAAYPILKKIHVLEEVA